MALKEIKINNSKLLVQDYVNVTNTRAGEYIVTVGDRTHCIFGGRALGGSARDWWVDGFGGDAIKVSGPVEAINLIVGF